MMSEDYLFLGGPLHGTVGPIDNGVDHLTIPVNLSKAQRDPESGVVMLTPKVTYMKREIGGLIEGVRVLRYVFALSTMPPEEVMKALSAVLVREFLLAGAEPPEAA